MQGIHENRLKAGAEHDSGRLCDGISCHVQADRADLQLANIASILKKNASIPPASDGKCRMMSLSPTSGSTSNIRAFQTFHSHGKVVPTLPGVDYFRRVAELQKKHVNGKRIHNAFQTNGVLTDNEWVSFFAKSRFLVGLSIGGPQSLHDTYRV